MPVTGGTQFALFGRFRVNLYTKQVWKNGRIYKLQPQPATLLVALLEHQNELVPYEELIARLWPEHRGESKRPHLFVVAAKLEDALGCECLRNEQNTGYGFVLPVTFETPVVQPPQAEPLSTARGVPDGVVESQHQAQAVEKSTWPVRSPFLWAALLAGFGVLAAVGDVAMHWTGAPERVSVHNDTLTAFDHRDREVWHRTFSDGLAEYSQEQRLRLTWIGDLYNDGRNETLLARLPPKPEYERSGSPLLCFSDKGRENWRFTAGKKVSDGNGDFSTAYEIVTVKAFAQDVGSSKRIAVISHHIPEWPTQLAVLNSRGLMETEYWHSGFLGDLAVSDLDGDGVNELVLVGTDNGYQRASLVVFDSRRIGGASHSPRSAFQLLGFGPGTEKAVVLFPRSCVNKAIKAYNEGIALQVSQGTIIVTTWEGTQDYYSSRIMYTLDRNLNVLRVDPDIGLQNHHRQLEIQGVLDHAFSFREVDELKRGCSRVK